MLPIVLNHMTVPGLRYDAFMDLAKRLGCVGVELRNDLPGVLFDGDAPEQVAAKARETSLRIVGISEVHAFNAWSDAVRSKVESLIDMAVRCGAETISLIPRNDGQGLGEGERQANLRLALREIKPLLEAHDMVALVEPLGFLTSSLRDKQEAVEIIESLGAAARYKLVHDTFHHRLAGGGAIFPEHTGIVHVSGVADPAPAISQMRDEHRILVDADDRLGNVEQVAHLRAAGYSGPISFEVFSPVVHRLADPETALRTSIAYMEHQLARIAA